jgi:prepilin-type N-terminal cleavage/methylation domain-containing protein
MRTQLRTPNSELRTPRSGFTLVEIMMVITVIAVLMTLTIGVVGKFIDNARHSATESTLSKIQSMMDSRRQAFERLINRRGFLVGSAEYQIAGSGGTFGLSGENQKIVARKILQMKYFPQTSEDLTLMVTQFYKNNAAAQAQLVLMYPSLFQPNTSPPVPLTGLSNAEILYAMLTQGAVIGDSPLGTDSFSASEVKSDATIGAGLPFFIDAWGQKIRFYRWPTRLFRSGGVLSNGSLAAITHSEAPNPTSSNTDAAKSFDTTNAKFAFSTLPVFTGNLFNDLARDPDDPLKSALSMGTIVTPTVFEAAFHTPATFHMPLIISAGPDQQLGLLEPDTPTATNANGRLALLDPSDAGALDKLMDNIVSASIKAGGK